ncbi:MAG: hypothetical protein IT389_03975 [Nitrospira sp.]|nr:hypothetical protein [Nitrospira sp.]
MMKCASLLFVAVLLAPVAVMAEGSGAGVSDVNMEILKEKLKADKKLLIAGNMDLTEAEAKQFWPIYESYQAELKGLNDRLGRTILMYAQGYEEGKGHITEDMAKQLLSEYLAVEDTETKLRRTYADKVGQVLPATKTARYLQMESKIRALLRFELAQQIPLVY